MRKIYIYLIDQCRIENKINITHNRTWFYENGNQKHSGWEAEYQVSKHLNVPIFSLFIFSKLRPKNQNEDGRFRLYV